MKTTRLLAPGILAAMLSASALLCPPAIAGTVASYGYAGVVDVCDDSALGGGICDVELFIGDPIGGSVTLDASAGLINQLFGPDDVITFVVGVGDTGGGLGATPENSTLTADSYLATDSEGLIFDGYVSILVDPALLPIAINVDVDAGRFEILLFPDMLDLLLVGGTGGFLAPVTVPLPAGLYLLGAALLGLVGARRRRYA